MLEPNSAFDLLSEEVRRIASDLGLEKETGIQTLAIPAILNGENALLIAPTGSGKTEAALLPIFEQIYLERQEKFIEGVKAIYVTPLRALNRDMLKRLEQWAERLDLKVEVRHGDTSQKARRAQALHPPDILITTPETLQAILIGSRLRANLSNLKWIVVDEIHQLASNRRGSQLSVALERLVNLVGEDKKIQRIGLSATVANSEDVAKFLCGERRTFQIVDVSLTLPKISGYTIEFPEPTPEDDLKSREIFTTPQAMARMQRIADLIAGKDSTLIFVNSRTVAETLSSRFAMLGVKIGVHHGSLSREVRERVEAEFKEGRIRALVCTSTLELGIDIGSVDLVVQYMSPRQVNSLIQRVGRSGHSLSRKSEGIILSVSPEDSLESIVAASEASKKNLEPVLIHECPLDVLAHQVAGLLMEQSERKVDEILSMIKRAFPFRDLTRERLKSVLAYMETLGYVRISEETLIRRGKCRNYYLENLSMIQDERRYPVIDVATQQKVGILGEEFMIIHAQVGAHFIMKGRIWQIEAIQQENVYVTPVEDPTAAAPGWDGELLPIPEKISKLVGSERGWVESRLKAGIGESELLDDAKKWNADRAARASIISEVKRQVTNAEVPTDKRIVVEAFNRYLIIHTSAGDRINTTLGELFEEILLRAPGMIRHWWSDGYRILIELTTDEYVLEEIVAKLFQFTPGTEGFLNSIIRKHFPFGYQMKFIADRFGALKRGQTLSIEALKELTVKFRFTPIYDETLREALLTQVDLPGTIKLLSDCNSQKLELKPVRSLERPSPLALYIMTRYAEMEEFGEPNLNSIDSLKASLMKETVSLLCFSCASLQEYVRVGDLEETPMCPSCKSPLLAVLFYGARYAKFSLEERRKGQKVSEEEAEILSRARRSADIVLSYGKNGVIALSVYGIGPQTASKILSRMHETEEAFYKDLMQAKLKFIETKPYWD